MGIPTRVMQLPFLKESKWPRSGEPREEKSINLSYDAQLAEHCAEELWDAVSAKDASKFRQSLTALVLNLREQAHGSA